MNYIVYDIITNRIKRTGICSLATFKIEAHTGEAIIEGFANDFTQKIIDRKVVDKTPEEIEIDNPTPPKILFKNRMVHMTNEQYQSILDRLDSLEIKKKG